MNQPGSQKQLISSHLVFTLVLIRLMRSRKAEDVLLIVSQHSSKEPQMSPPLALFSFLQDSNGCFSSTAASVLSEAVMSAGDATLYSINLNLWHILSFSDRKVLIKHTYVKNKIHFASLCVSVCFIHGEMEFLYYRTLIIVTSAVYLLAVRAAHSAQAWRFKNFKSSPDTIICQKMTKSSWSWMYNRQVRPNKILRETSWFHISVKAGNLRPGSAADLLPSEQDLQTAKCTVKTQRIFLHWTSFIYNCQSSIQSLKSNKVCTYFWWSHSWYKHNKKTEDKGGRNK